MRSIRFRPVLITAAAAAAVSLTGCVDVDVHTKLAADGTGTMSTKIGFTDGFVSIMKKMEELDADEDMLKTAGEITFKQPTEEEKAAMKALGCELLEFEGEASETKIFSRFKVAFNSVNALTALDNMRMSDGSDAGGGPGSEMSLTKNDDGTYTLTMGNGDSGDDEEVDLDDILEDDGNEPEIDEDPEEAMRKAAAAMELLGEMMGEMSKLKIQIGIEVPGEVVSYSPETFATVDGGVVKWTMDFTSMMSSGADPDSMEDGFSVTFKMAEGESLPASALTTPDGPTTSSGVDEEIEAPPSDE